MLPKGNLKYARFSLKRIINYKKKFTLREKLQKIRTISKNSDEL